MTNLPLLSQISPDPNILFVDSTLCKNGFLKKSVFLHDKYLAINYFSPGRTSGVEGQAEFPVASVEWIRDTIVKGFWTPPSKGGLAKDKHTLEAVFEGEKIFITRSMNAGAYNEKGFKFTNTTRPNRKLSRIPQSQKLTDSQVKQYLLPAIEEILKSSA